jgi:hypothetical protein
MEGTYRFTATMLTSADLMTTIRLQSDNARLLSGRSGVHPNQNTNNSQDSRLSLENKKLKADIQYLDHFIGRLRSSMAYNITQLDCAFDGWRLFDCIHASFRDITDGNNSMREMPGIDHIFIELLKDWVQDEQFINQYNYERRTILQHHRAHEKAQQGRGVASHLIKNRFVKTDEKRGIPTKY